MTQPRCLLWTLALLAFLATSASAGYSDPHDFWRAFRQAVLANDISTIMKLTKFPLEVGGEIDADPVRRYDRKAFPAIYRKLINQEEDVPVKGKFVSKTLFDLVKEKKALTTKDFGTRNFLKVYDLEFNRINGAWFFTTSYLAGEDIHLN